MMKKRITMEQLIDALRNNWNGFEDLREYIIKEGLFFSAMMMIALTALPTDFSKVLTIGIPAIII
ncbi:MAG: hypothetical protein L6V93_04055 [Clostridiales bacterium]|nr:MAG: hypothetical protein L6V93_04055 [Clostridiales bacterium]